MSYGQFAYVYDRLMADMPYDSWVRFAERAWAAGNIRPVRVVELGCGTGNIAIPLAERGYQVTGIDLSEDMLAVAQSKHAGKWGARSASAPSGASTVEWQQQDMREWTADEPVDAVISFCDCLNYLTDDEDIIRMFQATYSNLAPGGVFAFDVHTPQQLEAYAGSQPFTLDEESIAYIWTCEFDASLCEIEHSITFFTAEPSGLFRRFEETHVQRAYPLDWLESALAETGFQDIRITSDFTDKPPSGNTQRAFFTARK